MSASHRSHVRTAIEGDNALGKLIVGQKQVPVLILNESVGGIGLVAVNLAGIEAGSRVTFESKVRRVEGRIANLRYVNVLEAHIFRIGLEWSD